MKNTFELVHVGINNNSHEESTQLANLLCTLFNLTPRHGGKSEFAGNYFECMNMPFLGTHGHIAMQTEDLEAAVEELKEKGFSFNMDTAAYREDPAACRARVYARAREFFPRAREEALRRLLG